MSHYSPHPSAAFEGWYSKFRLPSGASIALIITLIPSVDPARQKQTRWFGSSSGSAPVASRSIHDIPGRPYQVLFTYVSPDSTGWWQREYWPDSIEVEQTRCGKGRGFKVSWDGGEFGWTPPEESEDGVDRVFWRIEEEDLRFEAETIGVSPIVDEVAGSSTFGDGGSDDEIGSSKAERRLGSEDFAEGRTPWRPGDPGSTPAGALANLPLPIQWHVHSVDSRCEFSLDIRDGGIEIVGAASSGSSDPLASASPPDLRSRSLSGKLVTGTAHNHNLSLPHPHPLDRSGIAHVHTEKNWAASFPTSYIWIQARDHDDSTGVCLAGGALVPGVQAYLVGYQGSLTRSTASETFSAPSLFRPSSTTPSAGPEKSRRFNSFAPPTSTSLPFLSLGLASNISYPAREANIIINGWFTRLTIRATAPPETFFTLAAPLSTGMRPEYTVQSFGARVEVVVEERGWGWEGLAGSMLGRGGGWRQVERRVYERGSLEFGGEFYKAHQE